MYLHIKLTRIVTDVRSRVNNEPAAVQSYSPLQTSWLTEIAYQSSPFYSDSPSDRVARLSAMTGMEIVADYDRSAKGMVDSSGFDCLPAHQGIAHSAKGMIDRKFYIHVESTALLHSTTAITNHITWRCISRSIFVHLSPESKG